MTRTTHSGWRKHRARAEPQAAQIWTACRSTLSFLTSLQHTSSVRPQNRTNKTMDRLLAVSSYHPDLRQAIELQLSPINAAPMWRWPGHKYPGPPKEPGLDKTPLGSGYGRSLPVAPTCFWGPSLSALFLRPRTRRRTKQHPRRGG